MQSDHPMTKVHQLAHASFSVAGDTLDPEFWTAYFGLEPDTSVTKGQPFMTPSGRLSRFPGRTGVWGVSSKAFVRSDLLEPHLRYLVQSLNLPRPDLRQLLADKNVKMRFFCYWDNESGDRVPDVPEDIRQLCESLGGIVEIDEYR